MTLNIGVVCEGPDDRRTGCSLLDHTICSKIDWVERDWLSNLRSWQGVEPGADCVTWKEIPRLASQNRIKVHGHFANEPTAHDAHNAKKALRLFQQLDNPPDAIVFLRDEDSDTRRAEALQKAREDSPRKDRIVIGLARPMSECWLLAGFEPQNSDEREILTQMRSELGFCPMSSAELLTAKDEQAKRSPKRVLHVLTCGNRDRRGECCAALPIDALRERGERTGLGSYLSEIEERIVPLFGHHQRS